jgi:Ca2+-binding RTX toxin-like protein
MPTFNSTATLNGVNSFTLAGFNRTFNWDNRWGGYVSVGDADPANIHNVNLTFASNWDMSTMRFWGWQQSTINLNITDADASLRRITLLELPDDPVTMSLQGTRIDAIRGFGGSYDLNLGGQRHGSVRLGETEGTANRVQLGGEGRIEVLGVNNSVMRIDLTQNARAFGIKLDEGTYQLNTANGFVESFASWQSNNTLNIGAGGMGQLRISRDGNSGEGVQVINTQGYIGSTSINSNNRVTMTTGNEGAGQIRFIRHDAVDAGSTNRLTTGNGFVESLHAFNASNIISIGAGGIGSIAINRNLASDGVQTITARGWIGSLNIEDNNRVTLTTGEGGAGQIRINTTLDSSVTMGTGWVNTVQMGSGNDTVTLGNFGVNFAHGGRGNDTFIFSSVLRADGGARIAGGSGTDTVDFSRLNEIVRVSLATGNFQNIHRSVDADGNPLSGEVQFGNIENLIGGRSHDTLIGDNKDNFLSGGRGKDRLFGGAGDDTLDGGLGPDMLYGGAGNDRLIGGEGIDRLEGGAGNDTIFGGTEADTFVFGAGARLDRFEDFSVAEGDRLLLARSYLPGTLTGAQIVQQFGTTVDGQGALVFNAQDMIIFANMSQADLTSIAGSIDLF